MTTGTVSTSLRKDLIEIRGEVDKDLFDTKIDADSVMLKSNRRKNAILLVEDDRLIGDGLKVGLEKARLCRRLVYRRYGR